MRKIMDVSEKKREAAMHSLRYVPDDGVLGVGTGTTVNYFIEALATSPKQPDQIVSSSKQSTALLRKHGYDPVSSNQVTELDIYIDGADFINHQGICIKGAGGAMTCEKLLASMARNFICIVDDSKLCTTFPDDAIVPIEVLVEARSFVARLIAKHGGFPVLRENFISDNGNPILDVYELDLLNLEKTTHWLDSLCGVVGHGLFFDQKANRAIIGRGRQVQELVF